MKITKTKIFGVIYIARCLIDGMCYVGATIRTFTERQKEHLTDALKNQGYVFHRALRKHGPENFVWEVIGEYTTEETLKSAEIYYIDLASSFIDDHGYNLTRGGEGTIGYCETEEGIRRMNELWDEKRRNDQRLRANAQWSSFEHQELQSLLKRGVSRSEESNRKTSLALTGVQKSFSHRKSISEARKRLFLDPVFKAKNSSGFHGKHTLVAREKQSIARKAYHAKKREMSNA